MKKEINEIKKTAQHMKEEYNKDMGNFRTKNQTNPENNKFLK
jgi:hypothetical protein